MAFIERFVQPQFDSYEDFRENFHINVPDNFNFAFDVMDVIAEEDPDRLAMIWTNEAGEEQSFTFSKMKEMSNRTANYFASLGIGKGDHVMLVLKRHYEFWYAIMALSKLGAVVIPATNLLMEKDITYRVEKGDVKAIVCTSDGVVAEEVEKSVQHSGADVTLIIAKGQRAGWHTFDDMAAHSPTFPRPAGAAATTRDDVLLLFFSSGTTGMPKMVEHDHAYPLGHIVTGSFWHNVVPGGRHLTVADTGWGKALWGKLYAQWMGETTVFTYDFDKFNPKDLLEKMEKYQITTFCAPPTIYRFLIQEDFAQYDLSSLTYATTAGEALNPEVFNRFKELTGLEIKEAFGQTETTVTLGTFLWMEPVPGSMGKPAAGYNTCIVDEEGNDVHIGTVGEIAVRFDPANKPIGLMLGYYNEPEATERALGNGLYRTGDQAWMDENGFFWYVGRTDDVIKSSGYRIGPFEVESALMEHEAVLETAITAVPDPVRGQVVKATVVLNHGWTPSEELKKALQDHVKHTTAPYKYPRIVEFVEELPKTISGKIRRVEIRERDAQKN